MVIYPITLRMKIEDKYVGGRTFKQNILEVALSFLKMDGSRESEIIIGKVKGVEYG